MKFWLRYDLRSPAFGTPTVDLIDAALEQVEWADGRGFACVQLSEHHGSADGYNPSPLVLGAAVAARTRHMRINPPIVLSVQDPIRFAEDCAILDNISHGRLDITVAVGYVPSEFAMFGVPMARRGRVTDAVMLAAKSAWRGEAITHEGRSGRVTPLPFQSGGPRLFVGGGVLASAERAARLGDGFYPLEDRPDLRVAYEGACDRHGRPRGPILSFAPPVFFHVAEDPDAAWARIAPHAMHEANTYAAMAEAVGQMSPFPAAATAEELRATGAYRVMTPEDFTHYCRAEHALGHDLIFSPMMGGLSPELAWSSLELFTARVLPVLRAEGLVDGAA